MKWFLNASTGAKLVSSFGLVILLLGAVIWLAAVDLKALRESQRQLFEVHNANSVDILRIENNHNRARTELLTMMVETNRAAQDGLVTDIQSLSSENDTLVGQLRKRNKDNAALMALLNEQQALREDYTRERNTQAIPMILAGKYAEAKAIEERQAERYGKIRGLLDKLSHSSQEAALAAVEGADRDVNRSFGVFGVVGVVAVALALALAFMLSRMIATPLKQFSMVAGRVAQGDLTMHLSNAERTDEIGVLARAFSGMTESLRRVMGELGQAVNVVASSTSQITASTAQLAASASETAAAVAETTTTVEEVKQTSQLSSQKAKLVSEQARKAAEISQSGKQAVGATISGMNGIRQQMSVVSESILSLSAQGQAIGEIIATVDDLAAQSKLLSVNASIEAAKAGEEGKGFAVVAQEVRTLAEQSKQATTQVRGILSDIQKATSAAVLATEQATKSVDAGVEQSTAAGESIGRLASSVGEAAQAAAQIAATSQEQFVGMDQIAIAMENINQASGQSVSGTRQAETAAQQLNQLGMKLKELVSRFKV